MSAIQLPLAYDTRANLSARYATVYGATNLTTVMILRSRYDIDRVTSRISDSKCTRRT